MVCLKLDVTCKCLRRTATEVFGKGILRYRKSKVTLDLTYNHQFGTGADDRKGSVKPPGTYSSLDIPEGSFLKRVAYRGAY